MASFEINSMHTNNIKLNKMALIFSKNCNKWNHLSRPRVLLSWTFLFLFSPCFEGYFKKWEVTGSKGKKNDLFQTGFLSYFKRTFMRQSSKKISQFARCYGLFMACEIPTHYLLVITSFWKHFEKLTFHKLQQFKNQLSL